MLEAFAAPAIGCGLPQSPRTSFAADLSVPVAGRSQSTDRTDSSYEKKSTARSLNFALLRLRYAFSSVEPALSSALRLSFFPFLAPTVDTSLSCPSSGCSPEHWCLAGRKRRRSNAIQYEARC